MNNRRRRIAKGRRLAIKQAIALKQHNRHYGVYTISDPFAKTYGKDPRILTTKGLEVYP